MVVGASAAGEITCFDRIEVDDSDTETFRVDTSYSCNEDFGLMVPDPKIALVTTGSQPPSCGEKFCSAGVAAIPVYGNWTGSVQASLYQDGEIVDTTNVPLPPRDYGLVNVEFETDRSSAYQMEFKLLNSLDTVVDEVVEDVRVEEQSKQHKVRATERVDPGNSNMADHLYATHVTVNPKAGGCGQTLDGGSDRLASSNTSAGFETESIILVGGSDDEPDLSRTGPTCGDWADTLSVTGKMLGT